tara:strand:+ start:161 stop:550 length:390 start_codon:yes stop_codon:yes gene_type:complete
MTTSSSTTKREKIVSKRADVIPSNYHLDSKQYAGIVTLGASSTYTAWFDMESEAKHRLQFLKIALDYDAYSTMEEESTGKEGVKTQSERVRIMNERYLKSGRDAKDHPMHGLFTGLAEEYGKVSNNDTE